MSAVGGIPFGFGPEGEMIEAFSPPDALEDFFDVRESVGTFRWRTLILFTPEGDLLEQRAERDFRLPDGWTWGDYYDEVRGFVVDTIYQGTPPKTHRLSPNMAAILSGRVAE